MKTQKTRNRFTKQKISEIWTPICKPLGIGTTTFGSLPPSGMESNFLMCDKAMLYCGIQYMSRSCSWTLIQKHSPSDKVAPFWTIQKMLRLLGWHEMFRSWKIIVLPCAHEAGAETMGGILRLRSQWNRRPGSGLGCVYAPLKVDVVSCVLFFFEIFNRNDCSREQIQDAIDVIITVIQLEVGNIADPNFI